MSSDDEAMAAWDAVNLYGDMAYEQIAAQHDPELVKHVVEAAVVERANGVRAESAELEGLIDEWRETLDFLVEYDEGGAE